MQGRTINDSEALQIAHKFMTNDTRLRARGNVASLQLAHTAVDTNGEADYFVFNKGENNGYIIVAGDDSILPIIGYADNGNYSNDQIPENMQAWLEARQQEIQYLKNHPQQARKKAGLRRAVDPLLTTLWGQGSPFNNNCPLYLISNIGHRSATGCVATAMAQIMKYHQWPTQGVGSHQYQYQKIQNGKKITETLSADFYNSHYEWQNMNDVYDANSSETAKSAVARLMIDCGIAVDMNYGVTSGTQSPNALHAFTNFFDYDKSAQLLLSDDYDAVEWENIIRNELDNSRPVYFSGSASQGGHAFVCDGYDYDGFFHFNWGWNGQCNGYFALSMLNPNDPDVNSYYTGYNAMQQIIINLMPNQGNTGAPIPTTGSCKIKLSPSQGVVSLGARVRVTVDKVSILGEKDWDALGMKIVATTPTLDNPVIVDDNSALTDISTYTLGGVYNKVIYYTSSNTLADGKYYLRLAYVKDNDQPSLLKGTTPNDYILEMIVANGKASFAAHNQQTNIQVSQLTHTQAFTNQKMQVRAIVTNNDSKPYRDYVYVQLKKNNKESQLSNPMLVALAPGKSIEMNTSITISSTVAAGDYTLSVLDNTKEQKATATMSIANGGDAPSFTLEEDITPLTAAMPASDIQASAVVSNEGGVFAGSFKMDILSDSATVLASIMTEHLIINSNETCTIEFNGKFTGTVGETYYLAIYDPTTTSSSRMGELIPFTVCEPRNPYDINSDGIVDVNDLNDLINVIMGETTYADTADVDGDGLPTLLDLNALIEYMSSL